MIDHRRLGRELDIFHSVPLVGAGLPIWLPDGAAARHAIEEYVRELERRAGYRHVYSPPLARREMYELSGHLDHFTGEMFPPMPDGERELYLRPSLCPHHAMVFARSQRSYRELPLRIAELGPMYRMERSGVLGGLSRVRAISLNDAHIFCEREQAVGEVGRVLDQIRRAHAAVGIEAAAYRLSLPADGDRWAWEIGVLRDALRAANVSYVDAPGEAAFYGPKVDVQIVDAGGRELSLSTVQVDVHQPERFELSYVDGGGPRRRPVMIHRSLLGSMERLIGYLLEVHEGALPAWCAPVQVAVLPVADAQAESARAFADEAMARRLRAEMWPDWPLRARVREAARRRVPYVAVIGPREAGDGSVVLRDRDEVERSHPVPEALELLEAGGAPPL